MHSVRVGIPRREMVPYSSRPTNNSAFQLGNTSLVRSLKSSNVSTWMVNPIGHIVGLLISRPEERTTTTMTIPWPLVVLTEAKRNNIFIYAASCCHLLFYLRTFRFSSSVKNVNSDARMHMHTGYTITLFDYRFYLHFKKLQNVYNYLLLLQTVE